MATSPVQKNSVNQGPTWVLVLALIVSCACVLGTTGLPNLGSWLLTIWFAAAVIFALFNLPAPPKPVFLVLLAVVVLIAVGVVLSGQWLAVIPGAVAVIGLITNLR